MNMNYQPPSPKSKEAINRIFAGPSAKERERAVRKARMRRLARLSTLSLPPASV